MSDPQDPQLAAIIGQLSDIKSSLAVNTNETSNIKSSITEIKADIKEIKMEAVTRREFNDALNGLRTDIDLKLSARDNRLSILEKKNARAMMMLWSCAGALGLILLNSLLKLILK